MSESNHPARRRTPRHRVAALFLLFLVGVAAIGPEVGEAIFGEMGGQSLLETHWMNWWLHATRQVVVLLVFVGFLSLALGCLLGALAASGSRIVDRLLTRLVELVGAVPSLVLVGLWRTYAETPSLIGFVGVLTAIKAVQTASLVRDEADRIGTQPFILATRALGATERRVFFGHTLAHLAPSLGPHLALTASAIVGLEAALSLVGLGLPGIPTWGAYLGLALGAESLGPVATAAAMLSLVFTIVALRTVAEGSAPSSEIRL